MNDLSSRRAGHRLEKTNMTQQLLNDARLEAAGLRQRGKAARLARLEAAGIPTDLDSLRALVAKADADAAAAAREMAKEYNDILYDHGAVACRCDRCGWRATALSDEAACELSFVNDCGDSLCDDCWRDEISEREASEAEERARLDAISDLYDALTRAVVSALGREFVTFRGTGHESASLYIYYTRREWREPATIRISDHDQPSDGAWRANPWGDGGGTRTPGAFALDLRINDSVPSREVIRAAVARALRAQS